MTTSPDRPKRKRIPKEVKLRSVRALLCQTDGLYFNRYFFKQTFGSKMLLNQHHKLLIDTLDRTMLPTNDPEFISRLIINIPPGYGKSMIAVIHYIARGLAINPASRYLHLSYSDDLALTNSSSVRNMIKSQAYQELWPIEIAEDADSKKTWWTKDNGGVRAAATGGQVTGFRAGHMQPGVFTGACLIDDPLKPEDARSIVKRDAINSRYPETIASRLAIETVPVIVIMQRVHYHDLSGYLLRGGSGEKWHHLNLPVLIGGLPCEQHSHAIPVQHYLPDGWLWPAKHSDENREALESHRSKWKTQYMQAPDPKESDESLWRDDDIKKARALALTGEPIKTVISIDPAVSNTKTSDEHGIIVASEFTGGFYRVDQDMTRRGNPKQWADTAIEAYERHNANAIVIEVNQGGDMCEDTLRNAGFRGSVIRVHASKGKIARAEPVAALYALGRVAHAPGLQKLEAEMLDLDMATGLSNGVSPNRVDAVVWAITELSKRGKFLLS